MLAVGAEHLLRVLEHAVAVAVDLRVLGLRIVVGAAADSIVSSSLRPMRRARISSAPACDVEAPSRPCPSPAGSAASSASLPTARMCAPVPCRSGWRASRDSRRGRPRRRCGRRLSIGMYSRQSLPSSASSFCASARCVPSAATNASAGRVGGRKGLLAPMPARPAARAPAREGRARRSSTDAVHGCLLFSDDDRRHPGAAADGIDAAPGGRRPPPPRDCCGRLGRSLAGSAAVGLLTRLLRIARAGEGVVAGDCRDACCERACCRAWLLLCAAGAGCVCCGAGWRFCAVCCARWRSAWVRLPAPPPAAARARSRSALCERSRDARSCAALGRLPPGRSASNDRATHAAGADWHAGARSRWPHRAVTRSAALHAVARLRVVAQVAVRRLRAVARFAVAGGRRVDAALLHRLARAVARVGARPASSPRNWSRFCGAVELPAVAFAVGVVAVRHAVAVAASCAASCCC